MEIKENGQICPLCGKSYPDVTSGWYHNCLNVNVPNTACGNYSNFSVRFNTKFII